MGVVTIVSHGHGWSNFIDANCGWIYQVVYSENAFNFPRNVWHTKYTKIKEINIKIVGLFWKARTASLHIMQ